MRPLLPLLVLFSLTGCFRLHALEDEPGGPSTVSCPPVDCVEASCCELPIAALDGCTCPSGSVARASCTPEPGVCDPLPDPECDDHRNPCVLLHTACCVSCGVRDGYEAYNSAEAEAHLERCAMLDCDDGCATTPDFMSAECVAGECVVVDAYDPFLDCETDRDCTLALDGCCDCGSGLVAVAAETLEEFARLVCDVPTPVCDDCAPVRPPSEAVCRAGRCQREFL